VLRRDLQLRVAICNPLSCPIALKIAPSKATVNLQQAVHVSADILEI